jgi:hypothetical protein
MPKRNFLSFAFIKSSLNTPVAPFICFVVAFLNKCLVAWVYSDVSSDKSLYLLFAKTILEGHHPLENTGTINGLSNYFFSGAVVSPLYTLLAIPFLWLTKSMFLTSHIIDAIAWLIFLSGVYKLCSLFFKEKWIVSLFLLSIGFFVYPHEYFSTPKDTLAVGLICWSCVLTYRFLNLPPKSSRTLLLFTVLFSLFLVKYMYVPLSFFFIGLILLVIVTGKRKQFLGPTLLLAALFGLSAFLFFQYVNFLRQLYQEVNIIPVAEETSVSGFYPESLSHFYPFITSSFINTVFWSVQLSKFFHLSFEQLGGWWKVLDIVFFVGLLIFCLKQIIRRKPKNILTVVLITSALFTLFLIGYASVTRQAVITPHGTEWSFMNEPRFYLYLMVLIQMLCFLIIFKSNAFSYIRVVLLLLFVFEALHGIYFTAKRGFSYKEVHHEVIRQNPPVEVVDSFIKLYQKKNPNFVFASPHKDLRRLAQINNIDVLFFKADNSLLNQSTGATIIALEKKDSLLFDRFNAGKIIQTKVIEPFIINVYNK